VFTDVYEEDVTYSRHIVLRRFVGVHDVGQTVSAAAIVRLNDIRQTVEDNQSCGDLSVSTTSDRQ